MRSHQSCGSLISACILVAIGGCSASGSDGRSASSDTTGSATELVARARVAADTEVIRGPGVPTAPDDTLGTMYNKHQGPARILPAPDCLPRGFAFCISDTARTHMSYDVEEGGIPDERTTDWLVFAAERDSMQVFIAAQHGAYLWMSPASAAGFVAEHAINDASWIRARFAHRGTYVFSVRISSDSAVAYELRVAPVIATGASRPIGRSATLTLQTDSAARVAVAPAAMLRQPSDSAWRSFAVKPGTYRLLLVRDSAYLVCKLPCQRPERVIMHPAESVSVRP
jgi:hypothetical protein